MANEGDRNNSRLRFLKKPIFDTEDMSDEDYENIRKEKEDKKDKKDKRKEKHLAKKQWIRSMVGGSSIR